jgi:heme O synthase-like polyprenyltransferase
MLAWQYQHFYGIRWIYYDDYNNAGFKMEKDKNIACSQVMGSTILSTVLMNYSLHYFGGDELFYIRATIDSRNVLLGNKINLSF